MYLYYAPSAFFVAIQLFELVAVSESGETAANRCR